LPREFLKVEGVKIYVNIGSNKKGILYSHVVTPDVSYGEVIVERIC